MNWYKRFNLVVAQSMGPTVSLKAQLMSLRPMLAQTAQQVYDNWTQDETGMDEELGEGGICQDIAEAMGGVVNSNIADADVHTLDAQVGDQHVWIRVCRGNAQSQWECYDVDISPYVYETGGGYSWKKLPDVVFDASDISIIPADGPPEGY